MSRTLFCCAVALAVFVPVARGQHSIKQADTPPPPELAKAVADTLRPGSVQFLDASGNVLAELWFRKDLPGKATPEQVKNGLTCHEVQETALLGVIRWAQQAADYRKQKIKAGVYTLRLAFQPQDGDHMGTAVHPDFCLLIPAAEDKKPGPLGEAKELHELSTKASGTSHPAILMLFPAKDPGAPVKLSSMEGHWVLTWRQEVTVDGKKAPLFIGLTLVGTSPAA